MKERPILFSGEMVRAILSGEKTQTRRIAFPKNRPPTEQNFFYDPIEGFGRVDREYNGIPVVTEFYDNLRCPHGDIGDQLWVRETFCPTDDGIVYRSDYPNQSGDSVRCMKELGYKWKPSIFMHRYESRIQLEIIGEGSWSANPWVWVIEFKRVKGLNQ